jgi:hypothetical protein
MKKLSVIILSFIFIALFCSSAFSATALEYYNYGQKLLGNGNGKDAIKYFNAAAKLEPRNPSYYNAIGDCYDSMGNTAMAEKYHAYADKLSSSSASGGISKGNEAKIEVILFSGGTSTSGGSAYVPVFALSYEKYITPMMSVTGSLGYVFGGSQSMDDGMGDAISMTGSGFMVQGKLNWHLDKMVKGLFAGPNLAFMPISYEIKDTTTDYFGNKSTTTSKFSESMIMGGAQVGYTYVLESGFKLTGFVCLDLASETISGDWLGGMKASAIGTLQFIGVSAGYSF